LKFIEWKANTVLENSAIATNDDEKYFQIHNSKTRQGQKKKERGNEEQQSRRNAKKTSYDHNCWKSANFD